MILLHHILTIVKHNIDVYKPDCTLISLSQTFIFDMGHILIIMNLPIKFCRGIRNIDGDSLSDFSIINLISFESD